DQLGHHRADLLEYRASCLDEQLVRVARVVVGGAVEEAEAAADVVGELGLQRGAADVPLMRRGRQVGALDDHGGAGIAEDEVAVAVTEVHVAGANFRVDHQHRPRLPQLHRVGGVLDAEGGRGTGHVHVETEALDAQCRLHFDGDSRVGTLQVGTGDYHAVDVGGGLARPRQRFFGSLHRHLAQYRPLIVVALGNARNHALGIEDTGLVGDVTALDAGSLLAEGRAGFGKRLDFARLDGSGVFGVETARVGIERLHQLVVGNALGRGVKA